MTEKMTLNLKHGKISKEYAVYKVEQGKWLLKVLPEGKCSKCRTLLAEIHVHYLIEKDRIRGVPHCSNCGENLLRVLGYHDPSGWEYEGPEVEA